MAVIDDETDPKKIQLAEVDGTKLQKLFDSVAILHVLNAYFCGWLYIVRKMTWRRITMADGNEPTVIGEGSGVPVNIGKITTDRSFLVVQNVPMDLITGRPMNALKLIHDSYLYIKKAATFRRDGFKSRIPLCTMCTNRVQGAGDLCDESTSNEESESYEENIEWEEVDLDRENRLTRTTVRWIRMKN